MQFKTIQFEAKAQGDGSEFEGIGNAFHVLDSAGEIVAPGAFLDAIDHFLSEGFIGGLNHNWNEPIGSPTDAKEVREGLFLKAKISDTEHGKDVKILLKDKVVKKLSIGYAVAGSEYLKDADEVAAYWKQHNYTPSAEDISRSQYGARLLTKISPLYEVSPVTVPANRGSNITGVKGEELETLLEELATERGLEELLREAGHSRKSSKYVIKRLKSNLLREAGSDESSHSDTPKGESRAELETAFLRLEARRLAHLTGVNP